ncbi:hypothetical protein CEXT_434281 [Caerostris extrusa]|uniref:Uncharacterized protein n=1 Tax=Caerostris extrusa TaxID=172846 RepID=A0AAV4Y1T7_CAEEX|nr:hypothetical protein CEXT_434281 [Caerostris extrusa]
MRGLFVLTIVMSLFQERVLSVNQYYANSMSTQATLQKFRLMKLVKREKDHSQYLVCLLREMSVFCSSVWAGPDMHAHNFSLENLPNDITELSVQNQ